MPICRFLPAGPFVCALVLCCAGCGQAESEPEEDSSVMSEDLGSPVPMLEPAATAGPANSGRPGLPAGEPTPIEAAGPAATTQKQLPLIRTIEQSLRQPGPQGWVISRTSLELLFSIRVDETQPGAENARPIAAAGRRRMRAQYDRVRFAQELPGEGRLEFDSAAPAARVPAGALAYAGLAGNGFEFSLSTDSPGVEIGGFDQFLGRCLRGVPPEWQPLVRAQYSSPNGAETLAIFVDEYVALLPPEPLREGDTWTIERHFVYPVPMRAGLRCMLRRLTAETAEIEVQGAFFPLPVAAPEDMAREILVTLRGGQWAGNCLIDRRLGLPVSSRSRQTLEMLVRTADGLEFEQSKTIATTLQPAPMLAAQADGIRR